MTIKTYKGLEEAIKERKPEVILLDLWGVVHDGKDIYPNALETLKEINRNGTEVIILSNSPSRSFSTQKHLEELGIPREYYKAIVTSGEVAYHHLNDTHEFGRKYFLIGNKGRDIIAGVDKYERVNSPEEADFVIADGVSEKDIKKQKELLKECTKYNLPIICLNKDLHTVKQNGDIVLKAGTIAKLYSNMEGAGKVTSFGKPDGKIYERAIEIAETHPSNIMMIGDSPTNDIAGANKNNIGTSLLIVNTGLVGNMLGIDSRSNSLPKSEDLEKIIRKHSGANKDNIPTAAIPSFKWNALTRATEKTIQTVKAL